MWTIWHSLDAINIRRDQCILPNNYFYKYNSHFCKCTTSFFLQMIVAVWRFLQEEYYRDSYAAVLSSENFTRLALLIVIVWKLWWTVNPFKRFNKAIGSNLIARSRVDLGTRSWILSKDNINWLGKFPAAVCRDRFAFSRETSLSQVSVSVFYPPYRCRCKVLPSTGYRPVMQPFKSLKSHHECISFASFVSQQISNYIL